jgi:hypothetical protein
VEFALARSAASTPSTFRMSSEELAEWEKSFDQGRGPYGLLVKNTAIRIGPIQLIKTSATESEAFTRRINSDH